MCKVAALSTVLFGLAAGQQYKATTAVSDTTVKNPCAVQYPGFTMITAQADCQEAAKWMGKQLETKSDGVVNAVCTFRTDSGTDRIQLHSRYSQGYMPVNDGFSRYVCTGESAPTAALTAAPTAAPTAGPTAAPAAASTPAPTAKQTSAQAVNTAGTGTGTTSTGGAATGATGPGATGGTSPGATGTGTNAGTGAGTSAVVTSTGTAAGQGSGAAGAGTTGVGTKGTGTTVGTATGAAGAGTTAGTTSGAAGSSVSCPLTRVCLDNTCGEKSCATAFEEMRKEAIAQLGHFDSNPPGAKMAMPMCKIALDLLFDQCKSCGAAGAGCPGKLFSVSDGPLAVNAGSMGAAMLGLAVASALAVALVIARSRRVVPYPPELAEAEGLAERADSAL